VVPASSDRNTWAWPKFPTVTYTRVARFGDAAMRVTMCPGSGPARFALHVSPPSALRKNPPFSVPT
jgi:hypothetical protein